MNVRHADPMYKLQFISDCGKMLLLIRQASSNNISQTIFGGKKTYLVDVFDISDM